MKQKKNGVMNIKKKRKNMILYIENIIEKKEMRKRESIIIKVKINMNLNKNENNNAIKLKRIKKNMIN